MGAGKRRIGEVCSELADEFPGLSISKLRFLEDQGLVEPERTPGGYRLYDSQDVERLRHVLRMQRDHFLPLRVIKDELMRRLGNMPVASSQAADADRDPQLVQLAAAAERLVEAGVAGSTVQALRLSTAAQAAVVRVAATSASLRDDLVAFVHQSLQCDLAGAGTDEQADTPSSHSGSQAL